MMAALQVARALTLLLVVVCQGCLSQQHQCGVAANNQTLDGEDNNPARWLWQASLNISRSFSCGGVLINHQWVLTSAQCALGHNYNVTEVTFGLKNQLDPGAVTITVDKVICHPGYVLYQPSNDICLVRLSAPVNFSDSIRPICLASRNSTFHAGVTTWVTTWVTGYGYFEHHSQINELQQANVSIMGNNRCHCYYNYHNITDNLMCAQGDPGSSCVGHPGSPLMYRTSTFWLLAGILSYDYSCGGAVKSPGIYARVSEYEGWIKENVDGSEVGFVTFNSPGEDPDSSFVCPTTPPLGFTIRDDSIFGAGENLVHFTYFFFLCVVGLSLQLLVGGNVM